MMMDKNTTEPIYPCRFPLKVIGVNRERLEAVIITVMAALEETVRPDDMSATHSKNGKYVSITFEIVARSREHMDEIYGALNAQKEVKMVL